jgi:hypothetical protein
MQRILEVYKDFAGYLVFDRYYLTTAAPNTSFQHPHLDSLSLFRSFAINLQYAASDSALGSRHLQRYRRRTLRC